VRPVQRGRSGLENAGEAGHGVDMPLRAVFGGETTIDATRADLGIGLEWSAVYRMRPRPDLTCVACGGRMHAKISPAPNRLRFFAHDAANRDCPWNGQSLEHYLLKAELAAAIRDTGWDAILEAPVTGGGPTYSRSVRMVTSGGRGKSNCPVSAWLPRSPARRRCAPAGYPCAG
jgi:hypothetical protein